MIVWSADGKREVEVVVPIKPHMLLDEYDDHLWTPEEDARLLELLDGGVPREVIADKLGRTLVAIWCRTSVLRRGSPVVWEAAE